MSRLEQLTDQYLARCHEGKSLGKSGQLVLDMLFKEYRKPITPLLDEVDQRKRVSKRTGSAA